MKQDTMDTYAMEPTEVAELRLLDGPQKGARLGLRLGDYVLGAGDTCDICVIDDTAAQRHLSISVKVEGLALEALEVRVGLATGWLEPGQTATVALPSAILVGASVIGLGDSDTDWTGLAVPDPAGYAPVEADPVEADLADPASGDEDTPAGDPEATGEAVPEEATDKDADGSFGQDAAGDPAAEAAAAGSDAPGRRRRLVLGAGVALLVLAAVGGYVWETMTPSGDETDTAAPAETDPASALRTMIQARGLTEVSVQSQPGRTLRVTGVVADDATLAALETEVGAIAPGAVLRVRSAETLEAGLANVLDSFKWPEAGFRDHLGLRHLGNAVFVVDGFLGDQVDREALRRRMTSDVPGVAEVRFERAGLAYWQGVLQADLEAADLDTWLTIGIVDDALSVTGALTGEQVADWRTAGKAFVAKSGGWPRLDIAVTQTGPEPAAKEPASTAKRGTSVAGQPAAGPQRAPGETVEGPASERPALSVIGIIVSETHGNRVLLDDGESLVVGDMTELGAKVVAIASNYVRLQRGQYHFTYHLHGAK